MSKHSPALIFSIIIQFIAIIMAFTSFFLPIYRIKFTASVDIATGVSELEFKYRDYECTISTNLDSEDSSSSKLPYDQSPDLNCLPFLTPDEDMTKFGFYMKVSLAVLALGFIGSVITLLFTFIMSCHNSCRNIGMKIFAFLFSLVPFVFYLASPLVLLKFTYDFYIYGEGSQSDDCTNEWCSTFYGSEGAELSIPGIPGVLSGQLQWGPTYGWASGIIASVLALVSAILTVCSARYKKHHHHHHHHDDHHSDVKYSRLINQE